MVRFIRPLNVSSHSLLRWRILCTVKPRGNLIYIVAGIIVALFLPQMIHFVDRTWAWVAVFGILFDKHVWQACVNGVGLFCWMPNVGTSSGAWRGIRESWWGTHHDQRSCVASSENGSGAGTEQAGEKCLIVGVFGVYVESPSASRVNHVYEALCTLHPFWILLFASFWRAYVLLDNKRMRYFETFLFQFIWWSFKNKVQIQSSSVYKSPIFWIGKAQKLWTCYVCLQCTHPQLRCF